MVWEGLTGRVRRAARLLVSQKVLQSRELVCVLASRNVQIRPVKEVEALIVVSVVSVVSVGRSARATE
jgi:hypothetical protein